MPRRGGEDRIQLCSLATKREAGKAYGSSWLSYTKTFEQVLDKEKAGQEKQPSFAEKGAKGATPRRARESVAGILKRKGNNEMRKDKVRINRGEHKSKKDNSPLAHGACGTDCAANDW